MDLRKEKAALIKLAVLRETHKLIGKKPFEDLHVIEICKRVKISKVTFFHYFPQKEDLLLYHLRLWCLARAVELSQKPRVGIQGIYYLTDKIVEDADAYPGIMLSLVGYLADLKRPPKPFPVKPEEKIKLFSEVKDILSIEMHSLETMIESFVLDAIFKKEITRSSSTKDITLLLTSVIYGSLLTAHLTQQSPLKNFFRKNIDQVLMGLR
jgi:AcrR family transcriptional regulator